MATLYGVESVELRPVSTIWQFIARRQGKIKIAILHAEMINERNPTNYHNKAKRTVKKHSFKSFNRRSSKKSNQNSYNNQTLPISTTLELISRSLYGHSGLIIFFSLSRTFPMSIFFIGPFYVLSRNRIDSTIIRNRWSEE